MKMLSLFLISFLPFQLVSQFQLTRFDALVGEEWNHDGTPVVEDVFCTEIYQAGGTQYYEYKDGRLYKSSNRDFWSGYEEEYVYTNGLISQIIWTCYEYGEVDTFSFRDTFFEYDSLGRISREYYIAGYTHDYNTTINEVIYDEAGRIDSMRYFSTWRDSTTAETKYYYDKKNRISEYHIRWVEANNIESVRYWRQRNIFTYLGDDTIIVKRHYYDRPSPEYMTTYAYDRELGRLRKTHFHLPTNNINWDYYLEYDIHTNLPLHEYKVSNGGTYRSWTYDILSHESEQEYHEFKFYPNPSTGLIYLRNIPDSATIRVVDSRGQFVLESIDTKQIDISNFQSGIYFLTLIDGVKLKTYKIVKY